MLAVSGELNLEMGGPSVFPELPAGITTRGNWQDTKDVSERNRRSIYVFVKRNLRYPFFATFDMPDTHESCGRRLVTTTAPQALFLLNDAAARRAAQAFAQRLLKEAGTAPLAQINLAYRLAFSRPPNSDEQQRARAFLERQQSGYQEQAREKQGATERPDAAPDPAIAAFADFCHALLNASEFVYFE